MAIANPFGSGRLGVEDEWAFGPGLIAVVVLFYALS